MNTLEKVLVNRAQNGTYHKEELIEIAKKLWITGDISETVKNQVLEIIEGREDCEPPVTPSPAPFYLARITGRATGSVRNKPAF